MVIPKRLPSVPLAGVFRKVDDERGIFISLFYASKAASDENEFECTSRKFIKTRRQVQVETEIKLVYGTLSVDEKLIASRSLNELDQEVCSELIKTRFFNSP